MVVTWQEWLIAALGCLSIIGACFSPAITGWILYYRLFAKTPKARAVFMGCAVLTLACALLTWVIWPRKIGAVD